LKRRSVRAGFLTVGAQGVQFVFSTVSTIILARLLVPADFGLVAMVTALTGLAQSFADLGLSEATIQREDITQQQVSNLFWINVSIGLALTLATAGIAPVLAWFYKEPRLTLLTLVVSPGFLIGGLRVQHDALLRRQMRFTALSIRDVVSCAIGVGVGITMAWKGAGYWAIVAFPLAANVSQVGLSWAMVGWIPGRPRRDASVRPLIAFGSRVAMSYVISNLNRSTDAILIGWCWGAGPLGLYSRAYNLLMLPVRQLSTPARNVAVSAFSRTQGDQERFARYYLRTVNLMLWISTPVLGFLFVMAEPVIVLTLGAKWRDAAPVFQILAVSAVCQLLLESVAWLLFSRGESDRMLKLLMVISPIIMGSFLIGLPFGINGVALSGSLVLVGIFPQIMKFVFRGTLLTLQRLAASILCPLSLSFAAVLIAKSALYMLAPGYILGEFLVATLAFAVTFSFSLLLPPIRKEIVSFKELLVASKLYEKPA
jgi:PST family polysaccharide transporter